MKKSAFLALWSLSASFAAVMADSVPVLIWSNDRSFQLPHPLAGHTVSTDDFSQRYVSPLLTHSGVNVVLFIQDKLSVDDISLNADVYGDSSEHIGNYDHLKSVMLSMSVAQLPSVESPSKALADVREHFAADSVYSLSAPYHIADLTLGSGASNLVVVQLPNAGTAGTAYRQTLGAIDDIVGSVTTYMKSLTSPFVALYTATSSSHTQKQREFYVARESRSGRQLLESAGDDDAAKLICNITDTMFFYAENITIIMDDNEIAPQDWQCDIEDCTDNSTVCSVSLNSGEADLNFKLSITMMKCGSSYWNVSKFEVEYDNHTTTEHVTLDPTFVAPTPVHFSYHCYKPLPVQPINSTTNAISIKFLDLQIQAFGIVKNKFGYHNDCVGFFTVPIWMGVITMMVMLAIVLFGIAMLLSINTMDRYDDPKGKTITVTAAD